MQLALLKGHFHFSFLGIEVCLYFEVNPNSDIYYMHSEQMPSSQYSLPFFSACLRVFLILTGLSISFDVIILFYLMPGECQARHEELCHSSNIIHIYLVAFPVSVDK